MSEDKRNREEEVIGVAQSNKKRRKSKETSSTISSTKKNKEKKQKEQGVAIATSESEGNRITQDATDSPPRAVLPVEPNRATRYLTNTIAVILFSNRSCIFKAVQPSSLFFLYRCPSQGNHCPACVSCVQLALTYNPPLLVGTVDVNELEFKCCGGDKCVVEDEDFVADVFERPEDPEGPTEPRKKRNAVI